MAAVNSVHSCKNPHISVGTELEGREQEERSRVFLSVLPHYLTYPKTLYTHPKSEGGIVVERFVSDPSGDVTSTFQTRSGYRGRSRIEDSKPVKAGWLKEG